MIYEDARVIRQFMSVFFFQAEDGIRDAQESRGLGDVYKRQIYNYNKNINGGVDIDAAVSIYTLW